MTTPDPRAAALEALTLAAGLNAGGEAPAPVVRTGEEVYAGGDVARLLIRPAHLSWREGTGDAAVLEYADAKVGDTVLLSAADAKRLDSLGATVEPSTDLTEVRTQQAGDLATDEQLATMSAPDVIAYLTQHPDERDRVNALEQARKTPRKTVLAASEPTPLEDEEAAREKAAKQGDGSADDDPDVIAE